MSDRINTLPWQPWSLNDLNEPKPELAPLPLPVVETYGVPLDDSVVQEQQLAQLRLQAEQQGQQLGYAEGQQKGYDAGFLAGMEEGRQQGLLEAQQQQQPLTAHWQQLVTEFQHTLDALDSVIASRLMQLALTAAKQVLGQPPVCDGTALLAQIQQLIQQEPMFSGKPQLRVHPDDYHRIEQQLGATLSLHGWRLLADGQLHPGGCKVSADEGDLDASLATRWHELCRLAAPGEV
ncbi:flagellar assembly protein H [Serratia proteamaculans]|jgi:flagellar assembly protein FliH|uniref:Flagellar assembly protein FliH n=1 Tax=Serratia proteamaculans TaxID=28151 RepID=A0ABS0TMP1_SERPR|nr:flagellar assembly protein FliH [Serratia proteamaculans]SPZ55884.1 flagellar assembly protein H [Serratia quinivorans]MBI6179601.1 flagellar assembly protein FliH [Serratia proteamaculans]NWA71739.1 flagellar assembly protein FliH [Serratia proteamaculans]RYM53111.1 flagellar assembly protein FliH [Serratia proteamaculans]CAI0722663.1 flagellar assembly protein H [Serratia proteamaculans]